MPQPDRGKDTQERKSLTHRLNLGGVATPRPRGPKAPRPKAQKAQKGGHKGTESGGKPPNHHVHEETPMADENTATNTETQAAAVAEQVIGKSLEKFKGLDVKVRVQKAGPQWGEVAQTATYAGIGVATAAAGTGAVLGIAKLLGFGPKSPPPVE